jgi:hypothetical protein
VSAGERLELSIACACQIFARLALRVLPFKRFLQLARVRLPGAGRCLSLPQVEQLASRSRSMCGGSCLTESVVMALLSTRHGHSGPRVTIGIGREGRTLRAHAWTTGDDAGFVPLWSEPRVPDEKSLCRG